jgi:hypothetical protein
VAHDQQVLADHNEIRQKAYLCIVIVVSCQSLLPVIPEFTEDSCMEEISIFSYFNFLI